MRPVNGNPRSTVEEERDKIVDEPTWRCHQNPFIGDLGIQEPVILGEPQILTVNRWLALLVLTCNRNLEREMEEEIICNRREDLVDAQKIRG